MAAGANGASTLRCTLSGRPAGAKGSDDGAEVWPSGGTTWSTGAAGSAEVVGVSASVEGGGAAESTGSGATDSFCSTGSGTGTGSGSRTGSGSGSGSGSGTGVGSSTTARWTSGIPTDGAWVSDGAGRTSSDPDAVAGSGAAAPGRTDRCTAVGRGGGSSVSSGAWAVVFVGWPSPPPSPSMTPPEEVSTTAWLRESVKAGERQADSSPGNSTGRVIGAIGGARVRWIGGRNAQPIGDGGAGGSAAGVAAVAGCGGSAARRVQGQRTAHRSPASRVLMSAISLTKRRR